MASARLMAGRMGASRRASIDFPAPGGASIRTLWSEHLHHVLLHTDDWGRGAASLTCSQRWSNEEDHGPASSSSSAFASCRSAVSKSSLSVDGRQQPAGFSALALLLPEAAQACRRSQLPGLGLPTAGNDEGMLETGFGLGHIRSGLAQHFQEAVAPRLLSGAAEQGQESRDQYGWKPNPLQLAAQDADTRRRKECAHTDWRDANGTPGKEMSAIIKWCKEGDP